MKSLEYQKKLAEYDERISFHKMKEQELEYEKSRFVLEVVTQTMGAEKDMKDSLKTQKTIVMGSTTPGDK